MSLRDDMLAAAGRAREALGPRAFPLAGFVRGCWNDDGGFRGRGRSSDLYFTVFGLGCLRALGLDVPAGRVAGYLRSFGEGGELDFVHLACLGRCWAMLGEDPGRDVRNAILNRIEAHRSEDGGYSDALGSASGMAYACFLALGAVQDLGAKMRDVEGVLACVEGLRTGDGGYANSPEMAVGATPATAAAVMVLRELGRAADASAADWLLARCGDEGGFVAIPAAPAPDLLSTATALHALAALEADIDPLRGPCGRFVEGLWDPRGGFRAREADDALDCEYTFYGLLAMGHLRP